MASAINAAAIGIHATVISTSSGQILQITSTTTGSAGGFSIGSWDPVAQAATSANPFVAAQNKLSDAKDASVTIGAGQPGAYTVTSPTTRSPTPSPASPSRPARWPPG